MIRWDYNKLLVHFSPNNPLLAMGGFAKVFTDTAKKFIGKGAKHATIDDIVKAMKKVTKKPELSPFFTNRKLYKIIDSGNGIPIIQLGGLKLSDAIHLAHSGQHAAMFRAINPNIVVSKKTLALLKAETRHNPAAILHRRAETITALEKGLPQKIANAKSGEEVEAILRECHQDTIGGKLFSYFKKRATIKMGLTVTVVVGVGIGLGTAIDNHRKAIAGCWRYERIGENIKKCKVISGSCGQTRFETESDVKFCEVDDLPPVLANAQCPDGSNSNCVHCDSAHNDPESLDPNVTYQCNEADWYTALADLSGDGTGKIFGLLGKGVDAVEGAIDSTGDIISAIKYAIIAVAVVVIGYYGYSVTKHFAISETNDTPPVGTYRQLPDKDDFDEHQDGTKV